MNMNVHHPPDYSSVPQDNVILEHYGVNELNFESIKNYRDKFSAIKPNHPWNGLETKEFLYKIGAWGKVRNTNEEGLTLAGLLMFSEERIITEVLPQYFLEYRESLEETLNGNWSKRFTSQDGTWSGNIFDFYFKTSADLAVDLNDLCQNNNLTLSDETAAISCLHESLINALVHSDYYGEGGVVIEKEKNLFRFSNPGLFRISVDQALEGNISNLRNPNLFKMFILIGLCKRTGSGLKNMETTWKDYGEDAFNLIQVPESERTILTLHVKSNLLEEVQQMEEIVETEEHELFLFPEEEVVNEAFGDQESSVNNEKSSINNGVSSVNKKSNSINNDDDIIKRDNNSVNNGDISVNKEINSDNSGNNSDIKENNSYNNEENPFVSAFNSDNSEMHAINEQKVDRVASDLKVERKEQKADFASSKEMEEELWGISEIARRKRRLKPSVMEEVIVRLCAKKPLMLKELAHLLERTPDGLRNNYLAKLLNKGEIRLKYPDQLNHPKQAYIIVEK